MIGIILDGIVVALLLVTVGYSWKLSRRINTLNHGREDLRRFLADFDNAISRGEDSIAELKRMGQETDDRLREQIAKARFLTNDLSFLMDKGENVANQLEEHITTSRLMMSQGLMDKPIGATQARRPVAPTNVSDRGVHIVKSLPAPASSMPVTKKQALDTVLAQIADRKTKAIQASVNARQMNAANQQNAAAKTPLPSQPRQGQIQQPQTIVPSPQKQEAIERTVDSRRLSEILKSSQLVES